MYDVVRKGLIQVFRVEPDGMESFVSDHVDEGKAVASANAHGESKGGGKYRIKFPDKEVTVMRIIVQGAAPTTPVITVSAVQGSDTELDITLATPAIGPGVPLTYELQEATAAGGPFATIPATFTGNPLKFRRGGLTQNVTRHYRVICRDSADPQRLSAFSDVASGTVADITPNTFDFTDVTGAAPLTLVQSNVITLGGITTQIPISVSGGEYRINGGAYTSAPGLVSNGQTIQVRRQSSGAAGGIVNVTLNVGSLVIGWSVQTSGTSAAGMWPNWPIMNVASHQGNSTGTLLNEAVHPMLADKDLVMIQAFYPTTARIQSRIAAILNIRSLQAAPMETQFLPHIIPSVADKEFPANPGQGEEEITKEIIDHPTNGNERWYMHITGNATPAGRVEDFFDPQGTWATNIGHAPSEVNSLGETFATAFFKEWNGRYQIGADDIRPYLIGVFLDVATARPVAVFQNNGAVNVTNNVDFNYDGVAEVRGSWDGSATAGGSQYSAGQLRLKAAFEAFFPGKVMMPNAAEWDLNFSDGSGAPPLPLSNHPFYRKWEITMDEVANNSLGLRRDLTLPTGYRYTGGGSPPALFKNWATQEKFVKLDVNIPAFIGRGCVVAQSSMNDRTPTQDDIEFVRTMSLICLLVERIAPSVQAPQRVFSLDEVLVELGPPEAERSMGTFNENTLVFQLRGADQSVGVARFYWAIFQKGIVVFRGDNPTIGVWPGDPAVACSLPSPGTGLKWQMLNASNYVNPITGRATRNQTPTLNNGADVTQVSLRPYHAVLIRRVPT